MQFVDDAGDTSRNGVRYQQNAARYEHLPVLLKLGLTTIPQQLGKLKKSHVQKGYEVLKKIEKVLGTVPVNRNKLTELASTFYSLIPHDFGMSRPPPIDTSKKINKKMAMLEVCCVSLKNNLRDLMSSSIPPRLSETSR